jgi:hypothetical protein
MRLIDNECNAVVDVVAEVFANGRISSFCSIGSKLCQVLAAFCKVNIKVLGLDVIPLEGTELEFVIMVIAVSCVKLLSAHNSTQHTSRKHKV